MARRREGVPQASALRLSLYLRQLDWFEKNGYHTISSLRLGESLNFTDAQVRKDLAYFGQFGQPGVGYRVEALLAAIRKILGIDRVWNVVLVGVGNLGRALLSYKGFGARNFRIVAAFDADRGKVGKKVAGIDLFHVGALENICQARRATLAILTVPAQAAQEVAQDLSRAGIKGILNFAPVTLSCPRGVRLLSVDLTVQLEQVAFKVTTQS